MIRVARGFVCIALALWSDAALAQPFPGTLPPNVVIGRLGTSAGPAQAIPFTTLSPLLASFGGFVNGPLTSTVGHIALWNNITGSVLSDFAGGAAGQLLQQSAGAGPQWTTITYPTTSANSGGIPYFSSATIMASSATLAANQIVLGGGAGGSPSTLGSLGSTTTVLHGNAAGPPSFGSVATGDVAANAITNSLLAQMPAATVKCNPTGSTANAQDCTAFTLGGTVSGGGNQINNVVIGTITPLAGSFTTVTASTSVTSPVQAGGSAAGSTLTIESTSGAGTTDNIFFRTGSQVTRASITSGGNVGVGAQVPQVQLDVSSNANSASIPAVTAGGSLVRFMNADATTTGLQMDSIGAVNAIHARRSDGTFGSQTGLVANDIMFSFRGYGYTSAGAYTTTSRAKFEIIATETWSATANGSALTISTTPNGTAAFAEAARFNPSGGFSVGTTSDPGIGAIYTNSSTFLIRTKTSYTNGAAANTATLTNAPAVGNPTKWIAIDDNGTTRQIPAW